MRFVVKEFLEVRQRAGISEVAKGVDGASANVDILICPATSHVIRPETLQYPVVVDDSMANPPFPYLITGMEASTPTSRKALRTGLTTRREA